MSFEQDPNEQVNISGADLAMMVDEMQKQKALIRQLGEALSKIHASGMKIDFTTYYALREGLFAYQTYIGVDPDEPELKISERNPFTDEITIEGVVYPCNFFRNKKEL